MTRSFTIGASLLVLGTLLQACRPDAEPVGPNARRVIADAAGEDGPRWSDWSTPIHLGPLINAPGFDQSGPALSQDGLSLYFASSRPGGLGRNDLWVAHRGSRDNAWGAPQNLGPNLNSAGDDFAPNFSKNGHWMYFSSDRPGGCGAHDLYVSYRQHTQDDFDWQPAVNLGCVVNTPFNDWLPDPFEDPETGVTMLYFSSNRPGGIGFLNIYASAQAEDGSFGAATLVPELSSASRDARPVIAHDGLELFLASNRPGGLGDWDLWVSRRATTLDSWAAPVNVGATVNTQYFEAAPGLSADGTTLFFRSTRPGGFGIGDLWMSTRRHGSGGGDEPVIP